MVRLILLEKEEFVMATYTININERTKEGRGIVAYLRSKGVISATGGKGIAATRRALEELRKGETVRCKNFADYLESVK